MQNYMPFGLEFNPKIVKDVRKINEQLENCSKDENVDKEKELELRMERLYKGMMLNSGYRGNNNRAMYPY